VPDEACAFAVERASGSAHAKAAMRTKTGFLRVNMSQEVRTPVNDITGTINLLRDAGDTEAQPEYVDTLHCCSESLLQSSGKLHRTSVVTSKPANGGHPKTGQ
jgi:hypothetical protein